MARADIEQHLLAALDEFNAGRADGERVPRELDAVLIGRGGCLDSLGLVHLIVAVEERLQDGFGVSVTLADERAFSQERSPFRTLGALADYVAVVLADAGHG